MSHANDKALRERQERNYINARLDDYPRPLPSDLQKGKKRLDMEIKSLRAKINDIDVPENLMYFQPKFNKQEFSRLVHQIDAIKRSLNATDPKSGKPCLEATERLEKENALRPLERVFFHKRNAYLLHCKIERRKRLNRSLRQKTSALLTLLAKDRNM
jgi:hypothetical protein